MPAPAASIGSWLAIPPPSGSFAGAGAEAGAGAGAGAAAAFSPAATVALPELVALSVAAVAFAVTWLLMSALEEAAALSAADWMAASIRLKGRDQGLPDADGTGRDLADLGVLLAALGREEHAPLALDEVAALAGR